MPALEGYDCEGTLTIDSVSLNTPRWAVIGEENGDGGLWHLKFQLEKRGEDRLVPAAAGVIAFPKRIAPTRVDLRVLITGDVNGSGVANADARIGLETNIAAFIAAFVEPPTLPTITRAASLTLFGGGTIDAPIHVLGLQPRGFVAAVGTSAILEATLQISIPSGRLS